jgi:predicted DNA-binding transcriptional regulator AlpA
MEYDFVLKFKLPADNPDVDTLVERLMEAGCDDALIGIGTPGQIALDFTRKSDSALEAIVSALVNVKEAIPEAKLLEASPDFVGLTDVAELLGMTRQNVRKLSIAHANSFPAPVHIGATVLWHLYDVLAWFKDRDNNRVKDTMYDVAEMTMQVNLEKEKRYIKSDVKVRRGVREAIA